MKKTNSIGKVLLVTLLVSAIAAGLIELSIWYFGVAETFVALGIVGAISFMLILGGSNKPERTWSHASRERLWHQQGLSEEAFRQKYCK